MWLEPEFLRIPKPGEPKAEGRKEEERGCPNSPDIHSNPVLQHLGK